MDRPSRSDRLAALVTQARVLVEFARPTTACLLRVLEALTEEEIEILGEWELDKPRSEGVVDRLTAQLGQHRQVVREVLSRCLRLDVWGDYSARYADYRRRFLESGEDGTSIERQFGFPPGVYTFVLHAGIVSWQPAPQERLTGWIIEDNQRYAIESGFLVAKGRAFLTTLDLLETSARQEWRSWRALWDRF